MLSMEKYILFVNNLKLHNFLLVSLEISIIEFESVFRFDSSGQSKTFRIFIISSICDLKMSLCSSSGKRFVDSANIFHFFISFS